MHQALYRKYRPMRFEDVIGQPHITRTLQNQAASGTLSHAYLFCGPRGTGKTTCARILAKAANCLQPRNGDPCNECEACLSINDGSSTDVIELDAAAYTGVDNIRGLRDEAVYAPSLLRKKVYVLDEVHMLTDSAFNALLKILEEPPAHVMFVLASTEQQKIPATILSRCQRFEFKRIGRRDIARSLLKIASAEGIPLTDGGAELISLMADGAMRNALSLLEQASSLSSGAELTASAAAAALGLLTSADLIKLAGSIASGDTAAALEQFSARFADGTEPAGIADQLMCLYRDVLLVSEAQEPILIGSYTPAEIDPLTGLYTQERLLFSVRLLSKTLSALQYSPNKRVEVEMCIIMLCRPALAGEPTALAARIAQLERKLAAGYVAAAQEPAAEAQEASAPSASPEPSAAPAQKRQPVSPSAPRPCDDRDELLASLHEEVSRTVYSYLKSSELLISPSEFRIVLPDEPAKDFISRREIPVQLSELVSAHYGRQLHVILATKGDTAVEHPAGDALPDLADLARENPGIATIN